MGWFSRALRAANAALNSWYATGSKEVDIGEDTHLIGNVYINSAKDTVFTKKLTGESEVYHALLTITATNKKGRLSKRMKSWLNRTEVQLQVYN